MLYCARRYDEGIVQCKANQDMALRSPDALDQLRAVYAAQGEEFRCRFGISISRTPPALIAALTCFKRL